MKKVFLLLTLSIIAISLAGCNKKSDSIHNNKIVKDEVTINVKVLKAGYGTTWLYQLKEKFEEVYKDKGYKVNILTPDSSLQASACLSEMRLGSKSGIDIYFTQSVLVDDVTSEQYGICAMDLTDMYNLPAIDFTGKEESITIKEKIGNEYDYAIKSNDSYYGMLWANSPCGLIVNTKVLSEYSLEIPKTTDELFNCYETIYNGNGSTGGSKKTGVYPFSWGGNNSYGYSLYALYPYLAQILGKESYEDFINLQKDEVATAEELSNGYEIYENDNLYEALELLQKMYNTQTSVPGSINATHDKAHYDVITGKAAFSVDGDFFFSEVKTNYSKYLNDVTFVNIPVASILGVILKLDGTGTDRTLCDKILSSVISLIDENKTNDEIIKAIKTSYSKDIDDTQVDRIREARGVYYEKGSHEVYVVKGSSNFEICKLFLRMLASDDFAKIFFETSNTVSPYASDSIQLSSDYSFVNGVINTAYNSNAWATSNYKVSGLRKSFGYFPLFYPYSSDIVLTLTSTNPEISTIKNEVIEKTKEQWEKLVKTIE